MQYDDGFIAYLNGVQVAAQFEYDDSWNGSAYSSHDGTLVESFDLTNYAGLLRPGQNVLAFHLLNNFASNSTALLGAELRAGLRADDTPLALTATTGSWVLAGRLGPRWDNHHQRRSDFYHTQQWLWHAR